MTSATAHQHLGPPAAAPLRFDLDGDRVTVPELPTRVWLDALVHDRPGSWMTLVPGALARDDARLLVDRMTDPGDPFDLDDLERVAETVIGAACGVALDPACRLAATAYANWILFDGWCIERALHPLEEPIGRVLAAAYAWRRSLCQERSDLARLDDEIWVPAPAARASGAARDAVPAAWTDEREEAAFLTTMAALGGGARTRRG